LNDIRTQKNYTFDLNGESIILIRDDLLIDTESAEGFTSSGDDHVTVGLTIKLTEELVQEGIVRDVIRQVQTMRKNANFAVEDRIIIYGLLEGPVGEAIRSFEGLFKNEVLAVELIEEDQSGEFSDSFQIGDQNIEFGLKRVKS
jgi:isoleucyl-tRNA synthetase